MSKRLALGLILVFLVVFGQAQATPPTALCYTTTNGVCSVVSLTNPLPITTTGLSLDSLFGATSTGANPQLFPRTGVNTYPAQNIYVYNNDPALVPNLRKCLQNVKTQQSSCTFLFQGDSTLQSFSNGSASGDWINGSIPSRFTQRLNQLGIAADSNGVLFNGGANDQAAHNGQIVQGSSWTSSAGGQAFGGAQMLATTNTNPFTYAPNLPTDTLFTFYIQNSGFGSMTVASDSSTITTINANGAANILAATTTTTLGMHTYGVQRTGGGSTTVTIGGFLAYNSTKPSIHVFNGTVDGYASNDFVSTYFGFGTPSFMTALAPKVTFEECGMVNDWNGATTAAQFLVNCQAIVNTALLSGDVILITANPTQVSTRSRAIQQSYVAAMYSIATTSHIPLIDIWSRAPTWEQLNTFGEEFDNKHPNGYGYSDFTDQIVQAFLGLTGSGGNIANVAQAPTVLSGFGTGAIVQTGTTSAFQLNVGAGGVATSGVLTMPPATLGWNCNFSDITTPDSFVTAMSATTSTSVSLKNYSRTLGTGVAWTAADIVSGGCQPN